MPKSTLICALLLELCKEYNHVGVAISLRSEACDQGLFRPLIVILRRLPGEARTEDEIRLKDLLVVMDKTVVVILLPLMSNKENPIHCFGFCMRLFNYMRSHFSPL